jgi:hypothetical protein
MAATAQEITSEIARLQDRLRIARNSLANLNRNLQSNQAIIARYTEEVATIPGQVLALQARLASVQPTASAGAIAGNAAAARDDNANSNLPPAGQQVLTPTGRIEPAGSGSGTNAIITPTTENNPTAGTDAELRTTAETQAITSNTSGQLVIAEDGSVSTLRRNPETGDLYDPGPNAAPIAGPGAGSSEDVGGTVPVRTVSPSPQYQARNQSYVYQAVQVISSFKQGKFAQSLKGILYTQQTANTTQTNAQQREVVNTPPITTTSTTKTNQTRPPRTTIGDLPVKQQAAIASGTDPNTVNDQGMAFGGGGL